MPPAGPSGPSERGKGIGFIGLGQIGSLMAGRLVDHPDGLVVCDLREEAMAPLVEKGAAAAATPAELAATCGVISVMVLDDAQSRDVVAGAGGLLETAAPGTVIALHSTIRAETAVELHALAAERGVAVVDAPVSGGFMGAAEGTLATMVGGDDDAVATCRPVFEHWAAMVVHLGPVGNGTRAKLARNMMHFVAYTAAGEAQRLAEACGVDLTQLGAIVRHTDAVTGGPGAIMFRGSVDELHPGDDFYDILVHTRTLGEKDLTLALELADAVGVDAPLAQLALRDFAASLGVPHRADEPEEGA
ncbi:MAG: NAD(P)-dependent oxidoreductase [Acidimicrobiales bacterium]|nr:NAD(P)-dependent oxidoreductase [Acidimicrobiales bacterium]